MDNQLIMQVPIRKKYLFDLRERLMLQALNEGYTKADIAFVFNKERSWVTRIINRSVRDTKK